MPGEAIELGMHSRNTHENALEIKEMQQKASLYTALLVTSAAHMPRAMATFQHAGLPVITSTAEVRIVENDNPFAFFPHSGALVTTTNAMKEWIGLLAYRLRGWA